MYDPGNTTIYLATFVQNGDVHRVHVDDFDWANMTNLGYHLIVEETDLKWEPAEIPEGILVQEGNTNGAN
jgi:hypothetical protein